RPDRFRVIPNKRSPALIRSAAVRPVRLQILTDGSRRNLDAELQREFICDSFLAPCRILVSHLANEFSQVSWQARSTMFSGLPCPEHSKCRPVPLDEGLWFDDG